MEEQLRPYLFRYDSEVIDNFELNLLRMLNLANLDYLPKDLLNSPTRIDFEDYELEISENSSPLFLTTFSNNVVEALSKTALPFLGDIEKLDDKYLNQMHSIHKSQFYVIKINQQELKPKQKRKLAFLGLNTALPLMYVGEEIEKFNQLELLYEIVFHVECWSFKYNFENSKRNILSIFDREFMKQQNKLANTLLHENLGLFSYLFNQSLREQFLEQIEHLPEYEAAIHEANIVSKHGDLFFYIGYNDQTFKNTFFELLEHNLLATPSSLKQYFDLNSEYQALDIKHKSNNIMPYMLLYFAVFKHEALDDIAHLFYQNSKVDHQSILQKICSKFEEVAHYPHLTH
ncbi:hypothetical protein [Acinetobacter sp. Marseille-Q1618]|uniref:hypothetical protein n=1 Tax=Acinetobacter sp. Marseille-Q1618 TaxID=2697502 RepID=UPI00156F6DE4|nr:hypothetical protein [Acinetobacter sp. Marseille-Q1618]